MLVNLVNEFVMVCINLVMGKFEGGEFENVVKEAVKSVGIKLVEFVIVVGFSTFLRDVGGVVVVGVMGVEVMKLKRDECL